MTTMTEADKKRAKVLRLLFDICVRVKVHGGLDRVSPSDIEPDKRKQKKAMRELVEDGYLVVDNSGRNDTRWVVTNKSWNEQPYEDFDLCALWDEARAKWHNDYYPFRFVPFDRLTPGQQKAALLDPGVSFRLCHEAPLCYRHTFDPAVHLSKPVMPGDGVREMRRALYERPDLKARSLSSNWELVVDSDDLIAHAEAVTSQAAFDRTFNSNLPWGLLATGVATKEEAEFVKSDDAPDWTLGGSSGGNLGADPQQWGEKMAEKLVLAEAAIERAKKRYAALRAIQANVERVGGWQTFLAWYEQKLREELTKKEDSKCPTPP